MDISFRPIETEDYPFLREVLYQAIFIPPGVEPYDRSIIDLPEISKYIDDWGREGDFGLILFDENPIGAIWGRLFTESNKGYGFVNEQTPEISMAIFPDYRNRGYGTQLLKKFFQVAKDIGYKSLSLSADRRNKAVGLYKRVGFTVVDEPGDDYIMKIEL
ncbi:MAG: GNAT family N-acetyltransferase [Bacteroidales bacterium]|nr:GNAT family N-acetyltransferase [Bacteroidales bacterium]